MSATPSAPTYLEPLRDIDAILARIDALFACLGDVSEEKQWLYVATETQHCRDPAAIAAIADRSERKAAIDYNAAVQASIDANSLAPAAMQALAAQIQSCHKYYKDFHDASWDQDRTYALNLCTRLIEVLIPITRRLKAYADETTTSASGTLETIIYMIQGDLRSNKFAWDKTMLEAQGKYDALLAEVQSGKAQPIRTVDDVIASSLQFWYSPQNKHGPHFNPNLKTGDTHALLRQMRDLYAS
jgi:hypothetical protein